MGRFFIEIKPMFGFLLRNIVAKETEDEIQLTIRA